MLSEIGLTDDCTICGIEKPERNYVAFFLSFDCNLKCNYCINLHDDGSRLEQAKRKQMSASDRITRRATPRALRLDLPPTCKGKFNLGQLTGCSAPSAASERSSAPGL